MSGVTRPTAASRYKNNFKRHRKSTSADCIVTSYSCTHQAFFQLHAQRSYFFRQLDVALKIKSRKNNLKYNNVQKKKWQTAKAKQLVVGKRLKGTWQCLDLKLLETVKLFQKLFIMRGEGELFDTFKSRVRSCWQQQHEQRSAVASVYSERVHVL